MTFCMRAWSAGSAKDLVASAGLIGGVELRRVPQGRCDGEGSKALATTSGAAGSMAVRHASEITTTPIPSSATATAQLSHLRLAFTEKHLPLKSHPTLSGARGG